jgi:tetratricopeptide (TPR) repeat protein
VGAYIEDKNRKIIPRWRQSRLTTELGELVSFVKRRAGPSPQSALLEKIEEWRRKQTLPLAAEVVGAAIVLGREHEAEEAARFIITAGTEAPLPVRELAAVIIEPKRADASDAIERPSAQIRVIRGRLRDNPNNAVAWVDLSREYASLGLAKKAARAMKVAVDLAPDHRFILRSAARLWVHFGDPERAHHLLLRTDATAGDPWLMAAEIAVAAICKQTSEYVKVGRQLLRAEQLSPWHLSELAAALGTMDFERGNLKGARKLFRQGLVNPTANTVGQARWAQNAIGVELLDSSTLNTRRAFEARAWQEFYEAGWQQSLVEARQWLDDEPYSSRPAVLASYVAGSILQQYDEAVRVARLGLRANPEDPDLINNLAFALINFGELTEAEHSLHMLRSADLDIRHQILFKATSGLFHFRGGDPEGGRKLYLDAIQIAADSGYRVMEARAAVFLAFEEVRTKSLYAQEAVNRAFTYSEASPHPDFKLLLTRL